MGVNGSVGLDSDKPLKRRRVYFAAFTSLHSGATFKLGAVSGEAALSFILVFALIFSAGTIFTENGQIVGAADTPLIMPSRLKSNNLTALLFFGVCLMRIMCTGGSQPKEPLRRAQSSFSFEPCDDYAECQHICALDNLNRSGYFSGESNDFLPIFSQSVWKSIVELKRQHMLGTAIK